MVLCGGVGENDVWTWSGGEGWGAVGFGDGEAVMERPFGSEDVGRGALLGEILLSILCVIQTTLRRARSRSPSLSLEEAAASNSQRCRIVHE